MNGTYDWSSEFWLSQYPCGHPLVTSSQVWQTVAGSHSHVIFIDDFLCQPSTSKVNREVSTEGLKFLTLLFLSRSGAMGYEIPGILYCVMCGHLQHSCLHLAGPAQLVVSAKWSGSQPWTSPICVHVVWQLPSAHTHPPGHALTALRQPFTHPPPCILITQDLQIPASFSIYFASWKPAGRGKEFLFNDPQFSLNDDNKDCWDGHC